MSISGFFPTERGHSGSRFHIPVAKSNTAMSPLWLVRQIKSACTTTPSHRRPCLKLSNGEPVPTSYGSDATSNQVMFVSCSSKMWIRVTPSCIFSATSTTRPLHSTSDAARLPGCNELDDLASPNPVGNAISIELHTASCTSWAMTPLCLEPTPSSTMQYRNPLQNAAVRPRMHVTPDGKLCEDFEAGSNTMWMRLWPTQSWPEDLGRFFHCRVMGLQTTRSSKQLRRQSSPPAPAT